ncbi:MULTISPECIES: hypothetical protein [unclassified Pseudonocardia]|uniref:hypothetical protein n=1 Tax=unclassified Pseudonocardia TaxID=2619320 RepID=UPI0001FFE043|nr:hypothetical protein [Pseudonocardia sp. Ae707_Ps1]OLM17919.1 hypothetical protein Ae707Ps1_2178 [Pseudonocardia sp. Ae707_Ps1]
MSVYVVSGFKYNVDKGSSPRVIELYGLEFLEFKSQGQLVRVSLDHIISVVGDRLSE